MNKIAGFQGEYRFLSNFWPAKVIMYGMFYPTVEHAYQAAKTNDLAIREKISMMKRPGDVKKLTSSDYFVVRPGWMQDREGLMEFLCYQKFKYHSDLQEKLIATGDTYLEETNHWKDNFWGVCDGIGENRLGMILMKVRERLREELCAQSQ